MSNCSSTVCWEGYASTELLLNLKATEQICVDLFLDCLFYLIGQRVYLSTHQYYTILIIVAMFVKLLSHVQLFVTP